MCIAHCLSRPFYVAFLIRVDIFSRKRYFLPLNHESEEEMGSAGEQPISNRVHDGEYNSRPLLLGASVYLLILCLLIAKENSFSTINNINLLHKTTFY